MKSNYNNLKFNNPKRSVLEEIGNAVTHGVGSAFSIVALILMLNSSKNSLQTVYSIIYFLGMFLSFTSSTIYHSFKHGLKVKRLFRRFDYCSIYLLIGATFAPILLGFIGGTVGLVFFIAQWAIIATGITFFAIFSPSRLRPLHMTLYFTLGWCGIIFLPAMLSSLPLFCCVLGGGIIYSLGIIPFAMKKKCAHFIWHFFVLAGAVTQWIGIFLAIYN